MRILTIIKQLQVAKVFFHYADRELNLKNKKNIQSIIEQIFEKENVGLKRLDYIFCSDEYLLDINQKFLQHDFYTDIVTFDLSEENDTATTGEIYLSLDRVKDNSQKLGTNLMDETLRVIFHGALHLVGFNDKKEGEVPIMRSKEEEYINLYHQTFDN